MGQTFQQMRKKLRWKESYSEVERSDREFSAFLQDPKNRKEIYTEKFVSTDSDLKRSYSTHNSAFEKQMKKEGF